MLYKDLSFPDEGHESDNFIVLDLNNGYLEYKETLLEQIVSYLDKYNCKGLLIKAQDLRDYDFLSIYGLTLTLRAIYGDKVDLVLQTKYTFDELVAMKNDTLDSILQLVILL